MAVPTFSNQWVANREMKELGVFKTFKEAFKCIYDSLINDMPTIMILEQTVNITTKDRKCYYGFYDSRDIACDAGWLVDGRWVA